MHNFIQEVLSETGVSLVVFAGIPVSVFVWVCRERMSHLSKQSTDVNMEQIAFYLTAIGWRVADSGLRSSNL
jgi:hypothetical protein